MSEPKHFPIPRAWRYKYGETPKIIQTEAELEAAAAEGWVDHPVDFAPVPEAVEPPQPPAPAAIDWSGFTDPEPGGVAIPAPEAPKRKRKR